MLGGDFDTIFEAVEMIGSAHFNFEGSLYFNSFIANASFLDIGYCGSKFTWYSIR